jgi:beta-glucosidase
VLALKGFQRVHLKPGEKATVTFTLTPFDLAIFNDQMQRVVEPGAFDLMVGASSATTEKTQLQVVAK